MTAQGEDLLAWLDAAIVLREERAHRLGGKPFDVKTYGSGLVTFEGAELHEDEIAHIVLHDAPSVLRRCAADRKLMELHQPQQDGSGFPDSMQCRTCSENSIGDGYQYLVTAPCATIRALAEGYGWTGGER